LARIELKNIFHCYELETKRREKNIFRINGLNITWKNGTANALLGPSGCGKTTLLNIISGLIKQNRGLVLFDGKDVTELSPKERHIAQVFQFPVIYDTMSVYDNLAFPLRNDRLSETTIKKRIAEIADIMDLKEIISIPTNQLNSTDKQKVAVGRGIVRENTSAVLLDEPLTVIDHKLRYDIRRKLKEVQKITNMTMIYVTHDQHEALTFADYVTILKDGEVMQSSSPAELYTNPETPFCGYFIGSPGMNIFPCRIEGNMLKIENFTIPVSNQTAKKLQVAKGKLQLGIRPEHVEISTKKSRDVLSFTVRVVEDTGAYRILTLSTGKIKIKVRADTKFQIQEGDEVFVHLPEDSMKFYHDGRLIHLKDV